MMRRPFTRRSLIQRGAAGATILSLPGLLAACGGGGSEQRWQRRGRRTSSTSRNWPLYIDVDEKTKTHPTLEQFTKDTGIKVNYFEDINDNATYFAKIQGPLSQGRGIDRDIVVLTDNERFLGLMIDNGWVEKLDKDLIPNIDNLHRGAAEPAVRPQPRVLAAVAVGHDGDRLEREADRAGDVDHAAPRGRQAEGQGDDALEHGRLCSAR